MVLHNFSNSRRDNLSAPLESDGPRQFPPSGPQGLSALSTPGTGVGADPLSAVPVQPLLRLAMDGEEVVLRLPHVVTLAFE